jgi:hypothetical protein
MPSGSGTSRIAGAGVAGSRSSVTPSASATLLNVAYPRRAGRVDAEEAGRARPRRRHQSADLHAVEAVRIAFGALAPGSSSPAHDDRCDAERAMVEVENVMVEAKGLQLGRIHGADFGSRGCRMNPRWSHDNGTGLPRHNSRDPEGPVLRFTQDEWNAFLAGAQLGNSTGSGLRLPLARTDGTRDEPGQRAG